MSRTSPIRQMLLRAGLPALAILFMGLFGYAALLGPNGILSYRDYSRKLEQRQQDYACLDRARAELRNRVALVDPKRADPDMVDELVRRELNVTHPDEFIVPLSGQQASGTHCAAATVG